MSHEDPAVVPAPSTYEEAVAILQSLAASSVDMIWANLTEKEARALLKNLAPAPGPSVGRWSVKPDQESAEKSAAAWDNPELREVPRAPPSLSEKTLLNVLETAPDAIVVIDDRGAIVLVNAQTEKMFGYRRSELVGEKVEILVPVRMRGRHVQQRHAFLQAPRTRAMGSGLPLFGLRKDGREFPVDITLSPLKTDDGILVTSAIRDVTAHKAEEARLSKAEARYRSLVEGIPAVTFMAALDEGINELYVSPQIEKLLGFTQKEWLEDPVLWHRQLHPEDRARWHVEFARTCATAQPFRSIYRFLARDGRVVWVHGEAKVVRDKDGRPLFLQGVAFDITGMKNAEEELKRLNQTLDQRVAERTAVAELYSQELQRSNRDLEHFSFLVAHELTKPLDAIRPEADKLKRKIHAKQPSESIALISRKAEDMNLLIRKMLAYSRVGKKGERFAPTDCSAVFREVRAELRKDIEACGASVTASRLPVVIGHLESLKLVFRNLIDNAIKYRAARRLKVRFSAEVKNGECKFSVQDNGKGIKPQYLQRIFEVFKRLEGENIPGHGIGLSYCQRVIEYHGGKIWVESQFGKGTTFQFTLSAVTAKFPEPASMQ